MFSDKSRYIDVEQYQLKDRRGRTVSVVSVPDAPVQSLLGYHLLIQGQRVDHLASKYTLDEAGFWRVCEFNDVMLPEQVSEKPEIAIPNK